MLHESCFNEYKKIFKRVRGLYVPRYWTIVYNNIFDIDEVVFSKLSEKEKRFFLGEKQFVSKGSYCPTTQQCFMAFLQIDVSVIDTKLKYCISIKIYNFEKDLDEYSNEKCLYSEVKKTDNSKKALLIASNMMKAFLHSEYSVMNYRKDILEFSPIYELDVPSLWYIYKNAMFDIVDAYKQMNKEERENLDYIMGYINDELFVANSLPSLEYENIFALTYIDCHEEKGHLKYWITLAIWHHVLEDNHKNNFYSEGDKTYMEESHSTDNPHDALRISSDFMRKFSDKEFDFMNERDNEK